MTNKPPRMERRHFEFIADVINNLCPLHNGAYFGADPIRRDEVTSGFAKALRTTNPNFDEDKFIERATRSE